MNQNLGLISKDFNEPFRISENCTTMDRNLEAKNLYQENKEIEQIVKSTRPVQ